MMQWKELRTEWEVRLWRWYVQASLSRSLVVSRRKAMAGEKEI